MVSGATFRRFDSTPVPRRADVLETGDIGGDYFSTCYVENLGWLRARAAGPRKTPAGNGAAFAHFCTQKASGDKAVTSGDELSGLEFAGFSGQKTDFGARQMPGTGFRRKTSEFGGPGTTFDAGHEKTHFSEFAVFSAFCTKNGAVTKTGDIGKTFSWLKNLAVLQDELG